MLRDLPFVIGDFHRQDLNLGPDFNDAEVLLELVENRVVLPIVAYSRLKKPLIAEHLMLKFNQTEFTVERIMFDLSRKVDEEGRIQVQETVQVFPISAVEAAAAGLIKAVEALAAHACGAGYAHHPPASHTHGSQQQSA